MKANQISQTAAFVAIKFYGLTRMQKFRRLFDEDTITFYEKLVQSLPAPLKYYHYWLQFPWVRKIYTWSEELMLPGDLLHVVARKYIIQQLTDELINDGYKQIVVLGSGFDHLAYRYAQRNVSAIEIDTPHMAELKKDFFEQCYADRSHPEILTLHLPSDSFDTVLAQSTTIDLDKKTIIIAEGFFDYLTPKTVSSLLAQISKQFTNNVALISTHFSLDELPAFRRWVFKSSVSLVGEQLKFDASVNNFMDLVTDHGFTAEKIYNTHDIKHKMQQQTATDLPLLTGFYILRARQKQTIRNS